MEIVAQANGVIAGGHTITDSEPKYGLAVTGLVHPERFLTKGGAKPGDMLILGKALGTGLITTAHKRDCVDESDLQAAIRSMQQLNRRASEVLVEAGSYVHAVTDITGFGLLGHAWEMASQSLTSMRIEYQAIPRLSNALHYAELGCVTGGAGRNAAFLRSHVRIAEEIGEAQREILWDPQTSGGLFAAIDPALWPKLAQIPDVTFWHIGEVMQQTDNEDHVFLEVY
jgi:selenide,water dikinase